MENQPNQNTVGVQLQVPEDLHRKLKIAAASETHNGKRMTLREKMLQLLELGLQKSSKP